MMEATCPEMVMLRKMPKMCSGSSGMMTFSMSRVTMSRRSAAAMRSVLPGMAESPRPIQKERSRAVMMSKGAGISTVKKGFRAISPGLSTAAVWTDWAMSRGKMASPEK